MENPWRPDRWRSHCQTEISDHWNRKLRAEPRSSSQYVDLESLSTTTPMRIWQQAGLSSLDVKQATVVSWMYCGTYFTCELMHKMHKIKSPGCACKQVVAENIPHILLHCPLYDSIRQEYVPRFIQMNNKISSILGDENNLVISILDPLSAKLPVEVSENWKSVTDIYKLARKLCYRVHSKRATIYEDLDNK